MSYLLWCSMKWFSKKWFQLNFINKILNENSKLKRQEQNKEKKFNRKVIIKNQVLYRFPNKQSSIINAWDLIRL